MIDAEVDGFNAVVGDNNDFDYDHNGVLQNISDAD